MKDRARNRTKLGIRILRPFRLLDQYFLTKFPTTWIARLHLILPLGLLLAIGWSLLGSLWPVSLKTVLSINRFNDYVSIFQLITYLPIGIWLIYWSFFSTPEIKSLRQKLIVFFFQLAAVLLIYISPFLWVYSIIPKLESLISENEFSEMEQRQKEFVNGEKLNEISFSRLLAMDDIWYDDFEILGISFKDEVNLVLREHGSSISEKKLIDRQLRNIRSKIYQYSGRLSTIGSSKKYYEQKGQLFQKYGLRQINGESINFFFVLGIYVFILLSPHLIFRPLTKITINKRREINRQELDLGRLPKKITSIFIKFPFLWSMKLVESLVLLLLIVFGELIIVGINPILDLSAIRFENFEIPISFLGCFLCVLWFFYMNPRPMDFSSKTSLIGSISIFLVGCIVVSSSIKFCLVNLLGSNDLAIFNVGIWAIFFGLQYFYFQIFSKRQRTIDAFVLEIYVIIAELLTILIISSILFILFFLIGYYFGSFEIVQYFSERKSLLRFTFFSISFLIFIIFFKRIENKTFFNDLVFVIVMISIILVSHIIFLKILNLRFLKNPWLNILIQYIFVIIGTPIIAWFSSIITKKNFSRTIFDPDSEVGPTLYP